MITVGSRVMYMHNDNKAYRELGFYPPPGTLGTVIGTDVFSGMCYRVKWDKGTKWPHQWLCAKEHIVEYKGDES